MIERLTQFARDNSWATWCWHAAFAVAFQVVVGIVFLIAGTPIPFIISGFFAIGFYYGREKAQAEDDPYSTAFKAYLPWTWGLDGFMDFVAPLTAVIIVILLT